MSYNLLKSLVLQEPYYFPWRGSRCTCGFVINLDFVLVMATIYES